MPFAGAGTYSLAAVDAHALPAVAGASPGDTVFVLADTIHLDGRGGGTEARSVRVVVGTTVQQSSGVSQFSYTITGDSISVTPICGPGQLCVRGDVGAISATSLTLAVGTTPPSAPVLAYVRLASELAASRQVP